MEIDTHKTFLFYCYSPEPRTLLPNTSPSSSPSPEKISFQFTRETFKFIFDEPADFLGIIAEEADDQSMEPLCICIDAEDVDRDNCQFYLSVYASLERIGIPDEGLKDLASCIVESAYEVKLSEFSSKPLLLKVNVIVADVLTTSNPSTEIENATRESMEEENYGMVPTSEKAKKRMLTSITVAVEENSPVKDGSEGRERKRSRRESSQEKTCVICFEDMPAGSCATQVPCSHLFHNACIEHWLEISHFCPTCRFEFPAE